MISKLCRTCLKPIYDYDDFNVLDTFKDKTSIRKKLLTCVPEMNLDVFRESVVCVPCSEVLNFIYEFRHMCLVTEGKIIKYQQRNNFKVLTTDDIRGLLNYVDVKPDIFDNSSIPTSNAISNSQLPNKTEESDDHEFSFDKTLFIKEDTDMEFTYDEVKVPIYFPEELQQDTNKYGVEICTEDYDREAETEKLVTCDKENLFQCVMCKDIFNEREKLLGHVRTHIENQAFQCHLNENSSNTKIVEFKDAGIAEENQEKEKFQCNVCQHEFNDKLILECHLKTHTQEKIFRQDNLTKVINCVEGNQFQCNICQLIFNDKSRAKCHSRTHKEKKKYDCNLCNRHFVNQKALLAHCHMNQKSFLCAQCSQHFCNKQYYNAHLKTHRGKRFHCEVCGQSFKTKQYLKVHLKGHYEKRRFQCYNCSVVYASKHRLRYHIKSYQCDMYKSDFVKPPNLKTYTKKKSGSQGSDSTNNYEKEIVQNKQMPILIAFDTKVDGNQRSERNTYSRKPVQKKQMPTLIPCNTKIIEDKQSNSIQIYKEKPEMPTLKCFAKKEQPSKKPNEI